MNERGLQNEEWRRGARAVWEAKGNVHMQDVGQGKLGSALSGAGTLQKQAGWLQT